ncbi:hypothetical protein CJP74_07835, partial [Psittacicella melopsittaci]
NTPNDKIGDLDTTKYNDPDKVYYANGEGLFSYGPAADAAERADAQTGGNARDVIGDTTNPLAGSPDSYATGDGLTREIVFTTDNIEKGNTPNDKIGDLDTTKYNDPDKVYYANGEGLFAYGPAADAAERADAQTGGNARDVIGDTTNPLAGSPDSYATGDGLTREIVFTTDNIEKGNTPNDQIGDLDTTKYNDPDKVYYANGEGLFAYGPAADAAERADAQTGGNARDVIGDTTNPLAGSPDSYATGDSLTREIVFTTDNIEKGNTPNDKIGDLDTTKYNDPDKVYYANGEGLFAYGPAAEAAERADAQTGGNARDVIGDTTNPLAGSPDSYATGEGLTREIVFTTDNIEKGNTPNDKIGDLDTTKYNDPDKVYYANGEGLFSYGPAADAAERADAQTGGNARDVIGDTTNPLAGSPDSYATGDGLTREIVFTTDNIEKGNTPNDK